MSTDKRLRSTDNCQVAADKRLMSVAKCLVSTDKRRLSLDHGLLAAAASRSYLGIRQRVSPFRFG